MSNKYLYSIEGLHVITEKYRADFFPMAFHLVYIEAENYIYNLMKISSPDYNGGRWEYFYTDNHAMGLIAPDDCRLCLPNYFDQTVTAFEAGVIISLYAYSYFCCLAFKNNHQRLNELMVNRSDALKDYVLTLSSDVSNIIFKAID